MFVCTSFIESRNTKTLFFIELLLFLTLGDTFEHHKIDFSEYVIMLIVEAVYP